MRQVAFHPPPANHTTTMFFSEKKETMRPVTPGDLEAGNSNEKVPFPPPSSPLGSASVTVVGSAPNCEFSRFFYCLWAGELVVLMMLKLRNHNQDGFRKSCGRLRLQRMRGLRGRREKDSHCQSNTSEKVSPHPIKNENLASILTPKLQSITNPPATPSSPPS